MAEREKNTREGVRDLSFVCRQCFPERKGYLRLTLPEILHWKASPDHKYPCGQGHLIGRDSILCYFRVDAEGKTIDPNHEDWTRHKSKEG